MTRGNPLVSIVITCYNYADYVADAIESVLAQTYKNIELIVINDGSTDESSGVITELQKVHGFRYIDNENQGIIKTRNLGVSLAKGDYELQLDADDTLDPTYVEKCVKAAFEHGADIVYTQYAVFGRIEFVSQQIDHNLEMLKHDNYIHASALVRRSLLGNDPYDQYLDDKGNEDWDLFLGLCLDGATAKLVDEPLLRYRKHAEKRSRSDLFEGTKKEALVRHHIWSKQNAKHPDQFWYFSSEIDLLYKVIQLYQEHDVALEDIKKAQEAIAKYQATLAYRTQESIKRIRKSLKSDSRGESV